MKLFIDGTEFNNLRIRTYPDFIETILNKGSSVSFEIEGRSPTSEPVPYDLVFRDASDQELFTGKLKSYNTKFQGFQVVTTITAEDYGYYLKRKLVTANAQLPFKSLLLHLLDISGASPFIIPDYDVKTVATLRQRKIITFTTMPDDAQSIVIGTTRVIFTMTSPAYSNEVQIIPDMNMLAANCYMLFSMLGNLGADLELSGNTITVTAADPSGDVFVFADGIRVVVANLQSQSLTGNQVGEKVSLDDLIIKYYTTPKYLINILDELTALIQCQWSISSVTGRLNIFQNYDDPTTVEVIDSELLGGLCPPFLAESIEIQRTPPLATREIVIGRRGLERFSANRAFFTEMDVHPASSIQVTTYTTPAGAVQLGYGFPPIADRVVQVRVTESHCPPLVFTEDLDLHITVANNPMVFYTRDGLPLGASQVFYVTSSNVDLTDAVVPLWYKGETFPPGSPLPFTEVSNVALYLHADLIINQLSGSVTEFLGIAPSAIGAFPPTLTFDTVVTKNNMTVGASVTFDVHVVNLVTDPGIGGI